MSTIQRVFSTTKACLMDTLGPFNTSMIPERSLRMCQQFPNEVDLYRYRKQRGVNLGSWFVLERWITETPFRDAQAPAESDLDVVKGTNAKEILEGHWDSWVTDADWAWLAERGINTVRIPIGYYHVCGADPSVLRSTDFAGLEGVFEGAWARITNALVAAHKYRIGVLFDLHAAPGKQNPDAHSGTSLEPKFFNSAKCMSRAIEILAIFARHIIAFARERCLPNIVGVELLNEPAPGSSNDALKKWYLNAICAVRKVNPDLPIYISDSWMTDEYAEFIKSSERRFVVLDHHLYRCFTQDDINTPVSEHARRLRDSSAGTPSMFARVSNRLRNSGSALVVGEWSAAVNPGSLRGSGDELHEKRAYVEAQLQLFEQHCAGWFFWTYKKESKDSGWSFRDAVEAGVFPDFVRRIKRPPASKDPEREARKQAAKDGALERHKAYWAQFPGNYEHWRFEEGFATGWDDAYLFACKWARLQSPFVEEVGFTGPWMIRRKEEHLHREVVSQNVWECEHGFLQGYSAATEDMTKG